MSNSIEEALNVIAKAIYGKDVRQAFMDAIRICYSDATKKDNANMEVAAARGTFSDLLSRLNDSDNKIAVSANNVTVSDAVNHFDGTIDSAYVLKKIYGKTVQDPVDLSIKSVENVELRSTGKNVFDGELEAGYIDTSSGALVNNANRVRSKNYLRVKPNEQYTVSIPSLSSDSYFWIIGYDQNKNAISDGISDQYKAGVTYFKGPSVSKTFTTSSSTKYIKWTCFEMQEDVQIEKGTTVTTFEEYKASVQDLLFSTPLRSLPNGIKDVVDCKSKTRITKIGKKVYNGSSNESFTVYTGGENSTTICFYTSLSEKKIHSPLSNLHLICNRFKSVSDAWSNDRTTECISETTGYSTLYFRINISRLSGYASTLTNGEKIALFKAWLAANPTTVLYELATPTTEYVDINPFIPSYKDGFFNVLGNVVPDINMEYATSLGGSIKALSDGVDCMLNKENVVKHDFKNFECRNVLDISSYKDNRGFQGLFKIGNNYVALFSATVVDSTTYNAQIVKLDGNMNYVSKKVINQLGHNNDLAYNSSKKELYIAPITGGGNIIVLDSETLTYKATKVVVPTTNDIYNIAFDKKSRQFAILSGVTGEPHCYLYILDEDFNIVKLTTYPIPQDTTTAQCQGMEFIDGLVYLCYSFLSPNGSNNYTRQGYTIRDTDGKLIETVLLPDILQPSEEIEGIQIEDDHIMISTYTSTNVMTYETEEGYSKSYISRVKEATYYYDESNTKKNRDGSQSNPFNSFDEMFIKVQHVPFIYLNLRSNITKEITIDPPHALRKIEINGSSKNCTVPLHFQRILNVSVLNTNFKTNDARGCLLLTLVQYGYIQNCSFTLTGSAANSNGVKLMGSNAALSTCSFSGLSVGVSVKTSICSLDSCSGTASILAYTESCGVVSGRNNTVTYNTKCMNDGGFENIQ